MTMNHLIEGIIHNNYCDFDEDNIGLVLMLKLYPSKWQNNTFRPKQDGRNFPNNIFKYIIQISLKYVPMGPINNNPALVQIMAWRQRGDKPLSEPVMVYFGNAYIHLSASMSYGIFHNLGALPPPCWMSGTQFTNGLWADNSNLVKIHHGLVQERYNSSALAMELRLSCINPSTCYSCMSTLWSNHVTILHMPWQVSSLVMSKIVVLLEL